MLHSKRMLSLLLLAAMLTACACGSSDAPVSDTTASDGDNTTTAPETSEYVNPGVDYKGETFTILDYQTDDYFWQAASYSDIHAEEENGDPINDAQYKRNRAVEEALNIKLETYPVGGVSRGNNGNELRKFILADDDTIDAGFVFGSNMRSLLAEPGLLINIDEVPTLNYDASWWDQKAIETLSFDGKFKAITGDVSLYRAFSPMLYFYNKNVAKMYRIDNCYDLVREGKWTFDVLYDYSRTVATDLNGDSKMDENDRFGTALQTTLVADMLMSAGERFTQFNNDGDLELVLGTERANDVVDSYVTFINDILVNNQAQQFSGKYSNVFFELHIPMFKNDQLLFNYQQLLISFDLRAMETDYGLLPTPKYDEQQKDYCTTISNSFITYLVIPATNSRLDMTGHVMDALGYYSQQYVTPAYIDTTVRS
ncbi:MAG: hypothetical protein J6C52_02955, partial [Clostridia bacterium]|nr:hypothetical protein [Clostridia bacterium]